MTHWFFIIYSFSDLVFFFSRLISYKKLIFKNFHGASCHLCHSSSSSCFLVLICDPDEPKPSSISVVFSFTRPSFLLHVVLHNSSTSRCDSMSWWFWWSESTVVLYGEARATMAKSHIFTFGSLFVKVIINLTQTIKLSDTSFLIVLKLLFVQSNPYNIQI